MGTGRLVAVISLGLFVAASLCLPRVAGAQAPADGWVVWQSIRKDGRFEVYRARADGSEVTRMTTIGAGKPMWSPDGRWLAYQDQTSALYLMRPDGSDQQNVAPPSSYWFWQHDNGGLVVSDGPQYYLMDPESREKKPLFHQNDFPQFAGTTFLPNAMTHDNRYLLVGSHLYDQGYTGANGSFKGGFSAVMIDLLHKDRIYYLGNGCWPFSPPEGDLVFHISNDSPQHPDIYRMSLADLQTRSSYAPEKAHPDGDWGHEYNPRVSTDNKWVVYMTSTGCHDGVGCDYEIFLHRLGAGPAERSRVTNEPTFDGYPDMYVGPLWKPEPQPQLFTRPTRVTEFASASRMPPAQVVKLKNGGGGALGTFKVAIEPAVPWLSFTADASAITLEVKKEGLVAGRNQTRITVSSEGVANTVTIPVVIDADSSFPSPPDAGVPADDGGVDGGVVADAGATPDLGGGAMASQEGCGCRVGAVGGGGGAWLLVLALVAGLIRRRR